MSTNYPKISTVFFCHDGQGNILFAKRSKNCRDEKGKWEVGGGMLEYGLTFVANIEKELREEYGCGVLSQEFIGYLDIFNPIEKMDVVGHWVVMFFLVQVDSKQVEIKEPESIDEIKWVKFGNWPQPLHNTLPKFFRKYSDRISDLLNIKK
jgi:8-oxo-dGTP diphosphatase